MNSTVVMIISDDADLVTLLQAMLSQHGFIVMKAPDAGLALHLVQSLTPNVFLVDATLPGMDGIQLTRKLLANPFTAAVPVIVFAPQDSDQIRLAALEAGATKFLPKTSLARSLIPEILALLTQAGDQQSQARW